MRTTLSLPDDVYAVVRSYAETRRISLGEAAAVLILRGLSPSQPSRKREIFPTFQVPAGSEPITLEQTLAAEDEL